MYGGRGHYVLLTEPSTGRPGGLAGNVAGGTAAPIHPGAVLETEVVARILEDARPGERRRYRACRGSYLIAPATSPRVK